MDRKIVLENGMEFYGAGFGAPCESLGEAVFNTSMVGTGDMLRDSANTGKIVAAAWPLIGNCGVTGGFGRRPGLAGLVVREANDIPNNWRQGARPLAAVLAELGIPGVQGVDTRRLTRALRDGGEQRALITDASTPLADALAKIRGFEPEQNAAAKAGAREADAFILPGAKANIALADFGVNPGLVEALLKYGCSVTLLPCFATASEVEALRPDAFVIAGGAESEGEIRAAAKALRPLVGRLPILGLEAGHLVAALLGGGEIYRMKVGHHGCNHGAENAKTGETEIINQNHSFEANENKCKASGIDVLYVNKLDGTPEGLSKPCDRLISYHFTPELTGNCDDKVKQFTDSLCKREAR